MGGHEVADPASMGLDPAKLDRARRMIEEHVAAEKSPGVAAVVVRRGKVVLAEAHGVRNVAGDSMMVDTPFTIASATKPITAGTLMSLVEEGRIGLNQRVVDYIPEMPESLHGVLVHHLLTHTGGFDAPEWSGMLRARIVECAHEDAAWGRDLMVNGFLGCIPHLGARAKPGEGMLYASISYEILGEVIRRVTGRSVGAEMQERILDPVGMTDTQMVPDAAFRSRAVELWPDLPLYSLLDTVFGCTNDDMYQSDSAGGGLCSSARDNTKYGQMILDGGLVDGRRVLSKATVKAMTTNQIPGTPDVLFGHAEASWGYGFSVICEERWPYFGGGLVPKGSVTHNGAGGVDHWIDFENGIAGAFFELVTEMSPDLEPISGIGHRFQDVITAAVVD